ncbi:MAG: quinone-dependent dihydroorotate dehydrogenase [Flavobacteriaceae bacterium]|jgi:dihydroorotate dehydrogenase|nr:quinone-dependent dihydroorotate dehydrogenase [Pelagibacterales bacterium]MBT4958792.1 quinone-dependent dihydroorotate dehydrogenase [Flavobacteriaceae bacterium]MBT6169339.1 quinone-dependent dihydroorotate dehydrogenase [Flavobacteriaceae bacterium]MBT6448874.1 quinone-dependent dihydroorotate dehydrogenase [Flavobacteriaceae bacterium]MDG1830328.1 quinone-dependent dihydroorotate dehydrogenase [Flavobacteriaceae bacterium]
MYKKLLKPILFCIDPERVHEITFFFINLIFKIPFVSSLISKIYSLKNPILETEVFGIKFPNPIGLAAGFDKNAKLYNEFSNFGFGFIEIGTVTPLPQEGNPKKRLFRLVSDEAIINCMGFNNIGLEEVIKRLKYNKGVIVGGNIGKNKITDFNNSIQDYLICFEKLYPHVNYFAINVSSPNTEKLRDLQQKDLLKNLLEAIQKKNKSYSFPKPVLLKIGPDLSQDQLIDVIEVIAETSLDGIIATNTTLSRDNLTSSKDLVNQKGGLSGRPISEKSTNIIKFIHEKSNGSIPIIGVGGIMNPDDAIEKIKAGASLIQIYSGFVYSGPSIVKKINKAIIDYRLNQ